MSEDLFETEVDTYVKKQRIDKENQKKIMVPSNEHTVTKQKASVEVTKPPKLLDSDSEEEENDDLKVFKIGLVNINKRTKTTYKRWISKYNQYKKDKNLKLDNESTIVQFFGNMSKVYGVKSLYVCGSAINYYMKIQNIDLDLNSIKQLQVFLKNKKSISKTSATFSKEDVELFLQLSSASDLSLLQIQTILIIALHGFLRCAEIHSIMCKNVTEIVEQNGNLNTTKGFSIRIESSKTDKLSEGRSFFIPPDYCKTISIYIQKLKDAKMYVENGSFFKSIVNGKFTKNNIGINSFYKMPSKIALKINKDPSGFTGHAFRRSAATIFSDNGANLSDLKRMGRRKSGSVNLFFYFYKVAEHYIFNSNEYKMKMSQEILSKKPQTRNRIASEKHLIDDDPVIESTLSVIPLQKTENVNVSRLQQTENVNESRLQKTENVNESRLKQSINSTLPILKEINEKQNVSFTFNFNGKE
jgi:integrase